MFRSASKSFFSLRSVENKFHFIAFIYWFHFIAFKTASNCRKCIHYLKELLKNVSENIVKEMLLKSRKFAIKKPKEIAIKKSTLQLSLLENVQQYQNPLIEIGRLRSLQNIRSFVHESYANRSVNCYLQNEIACKYEYPNTATWESPQYGAQAYVTLTKE